MDIEGHKWCCCNINNRRIKKEKVLLLSGVGGLVATDEYKVEFLSAFFSTTKIYQVFEPTNRIQEGED